MYPVKKIIFLLAALSFLNACSHHDCASCKEHEQEAAAAAAAPAMPTTDQDGLPVGKVNLEFNKTATHDVLDTLCKNNQVTCDFAPNLKKHETTISLKDVSFREALNQVTASAHYDYSVENGTVHIKNAASKKAHGKKK